MRPQLTGGHNLRPQLTCGHDLQPQQLTTTTAYDHNSLRPQQLTATTAYGHNSLGPQLTATTDKRPQLTCGHDSRPQLTTDGHNWHAATTAYLWPQETCEHYSRSATSLRLQLQWQTVYSNGTARRDRKTSSNNEQSNELVDFKSLLWLSWTFELA